MSVLTRAMLTIAGIFCLLSTLLNCVNVFLRYVLNRPLNIADELSLYLVVVMVFVCMPFLELHDDQLCISTILSIVKSDKWRRVLVYVRGVVTLALTAVMAVVGFDVAKRSYDRNVITAVLRLPKGMLYGIVAVCFIIAAISWILIMTRKGAYLNDA